MDKEWFREQGASLSRMGWPPEPELNPVENAILGIEPVDSASGHWVETTRTRVQNQRVLASQQDSYRTLLLTESPGKSRKVPEGPGLCGLAGRATRPGWLPTLD